MPEGTGKVRNLCLPNWLVPVMAFGALAITCGLSIFSYHSYGLLDSYNSQAAELSALKHLSSTQEHQIQIFAERIDKLNVTLAELKKYEADLASLTGQTQNLLGLDGRPVSEVAANLGEATSWAGNIVPGLGGKDPARRSGLASLDKLSRENIQAMHHDLDQLMLAANETEATIAALKENLVSASSILASTPIGLPIDSAVNSPFGYRRDPINGRSADFHSGIDITVPHGTPIYATADGTVLSADRSLNGYGLLLTIDHGYGLITRYAHLSKSLLEPGQNVKRGDKIALVGNTGRSTGPHLHYETILGGAPVDPLKLTYVLDKHNKSPTTEPLETTQ